MKPRFTVVLFILASLVTALVFYLAMGEWTRAVKGGHEDVPLGEQLLACTVAGILVATLLLCGIRLWARLKFMSETDHDQLPR